ncbi:DUF5127 domain-containing protein [Sphingobacterium sp. E70]|uniref:DUF5127 domain-containing protein n=1 Tax=Sphingobacterium sp. E70 TaxID=2853439 RepID=UPI00211C4283|nr:DUF5127 domain-containing protein [Sphingobacterium sp. E70]ULT23210.1 DUF5127 domain-containing protein [Sphingobacterium sp. E70]
MATAVDDFRKGNTKSTSTKGTALSLNTIIPFGTVGNKEVERFVELGYDEIYAIQYFKKICGLGGIILVRKRLKISLP